jgi:hypothetical protein
MALRASLGALRRVSAFVVAPLVERNAFVLPSARLALAAPPVWTARAGGMSTVSDSQAKEKSEQPKEKPEQAKEKAEQQKEPFKITFKVVSTVVGLAGGVYTMWKYSPKVVCDKVLQTFESGGKVGWDEGFKKDDAKAIIARPDVEKQLEEFFYPPPAGDLSASYVLIVGEHGTGKSTAVRRVVREHEGINGAIYVNVPEEVNLFGGVVAAAVGLPLLTVDVEGTIFRYLKLDTNKVREEPAGTWRKAATAITQAASRFYDKHQRPAVLIIDASERLANKNPAFFEQLQDFAKDRTDEGSLRVVLVSSDGSVLEKLQSRSAKSRMRKPPFEVGDISDKEAVEFLKGNGVAEEQAEEAVRDITGGRFELLNDYLRVWQFAGNDATRQELFKNTRNSLKMAGFDPTREFFRALVSQKRIDDDPARSMWGDKHISSLRALLDKHIIAAHPDLTFTFHSRHVESFFKQEVFGPKRRWWWGSSKEAAPSAPSAAPSLSPRLDSATEGRRGR